MARLHAHRFTADPESCIDLVDRATRWDAQSASNPGARNSGGTTQAPLTPDRVTRAVIGGIDFARLRVLDGDNYVAGSNQGERCDIIPSNDPVGFSGGVEGNVRTYRMAMLMRPGVDYFPAPGAWNGVGWEFHGGSGGWPGGTAFSVNYVNELPTTNHIWNHANVLTADARMYPGDLNFDQFGGLKPTWSPASTPATINFESWRFLPKGTWEHKALDIALRIKWASCKGESGHAYYMKDAFGRDGAPNDLSSAGWIEILYRLGTFSADGLSVSWTPWRMYDGGTVEFANGGRQVWSNGPEPGRHYRPTIFWVVDTQRTGQAYWKGKNYRGNGTTDSSVYLADPQVGETWADVGIDLGEPQPAPVTATSSVASGDALVGPTPWDVTVAGDADTVVYFIDNAEAGRRAIANGKASLLLDPGVHTVVTGGGFHVLKGTSVVYRSPAITFTLEPAELPTDWAKVCEDALKATTVSYPEWVRKRDAGKYPDVTKTKWWQAFDALSKL